MKKEKNKKEVKKKVKKEASVKTKEKKIEEKVVKEKVLEKKEEKKAAVEKIVEEKKITLTRAFIAIEFSDEVIKEVARVQELLGKVKFTGKMTELENLHLTLKFLGEIDDAALEKVKKALSGIKFPAMKLKLGDIGTFTKRGNPVLVWVKVEGRAIYELQAKIDAVLKEVGFKTEERFMSHLTIARIKYVMDKRGFYGHVNSIHVKPIVFDVGKFTLKSSELRDVGPVYRDLLVVGAEK